MKNKGAIWLIVLVVVAVAAVPFLVKVGSEAWSDAWSKIWSSFNTESSNASTSLGFTVEYIDGTNKTFIADPLLPATILTGDSQQPVKMIWLSLYVHLETTQSTISYWHIKGQVKASIQNVADINIWNVDTSDYDWKKEEGFEGTKIWSQGITTPTIESKLANKSFGTYILKAEAWLDAEVEFGDLSKDTAALDNIESTLDIIYAADSSTPSGSKITAFTAQIYQERW